MQPYRVFEPPAAAGQRGERREQRAATRPSADCPQRRRRRSWRRKKTHLGPRSAARRGPGAASAAGRSSRAIAAALALPCVVPQPAVGQNLRDFGWVKLQMCCVRFSCHVRLSPETARSLALWRASQATLGAGRRPASGFGRRPPIWGAPQPSATAATCRQATLCTGANLERCRSRRRSRLRRAELRVRWNPPRCPPSASASPRGRAASACASRSKES